MLFYYKKNSKYNYERELYGISKYVPDENMKEYLKISRKIDKLNENQQLTDLRLKYLKSRLNELEVRKF